MHISFFPYTIGNTIKAYQGTNFNRQIASEFEGLFSYLSPEMSLFQALSGISLVQEDIL